jgi:Cys-tRNA(Pro)/Cys-tRNA(Cys) deacylase
MEIAGLNQLLSNQNVDFEIIKHNKPIISKNDASGVCQIEETAPTLILETENGLIALIISGKREKIEFKQLKKLLNCKKLQLANPDMIQQKLNMKVGQVPLIGHN